MSEFQQFVDELNKAEKQHPTQDPTSLPPRKSPKRQILKFNHRLGISLLIILALASSGAALFYHCQSHRQHIQATTQYHQPKRPNIHNSVRPVKIHHHVDHKHETKRYTSQMTRLNQSRPPISINEPVVNTSSLYGYSKANQASKANNSNQEHKLAQAHSNDHLQKSHKELKATPKKFPPINERN